MNLEKRSEELIESCNAYLEKQGSYPYLPGIIETLELIRSCLESGDCEKEQSQQWLRGLGRLITEDYSFSESELGSLLLDFTSGFRVYTERDD